MCPRPGYARSVAGRLAERLKDLLVYRELNGGPAICMHALRLLVNEEGSTCEMHEVCRSLLLPGQGLASNHTSRVTRHRPLHLLAYRTCIP